MGFKMVPILAQNPWVLVYGFTENHQPAVKTDRNSLFPGRDPCILDRLCNIILYMSFYGF
jgi:hypothetical protein